MYFGHEYYLRETGKLTILELIFQAKIVHKIKLRLILKF